MSGGLMQLVAYGAQDVYLTGNPEITFFKVVYRRYTNFAIETVNLTFNGNADFGKECNVLITRNGDLVTRMYLRIQLSKLLMTNASSLSDTERAQFYFAYVREIGNYIIDWIRFEIGGTQIDKHWGHWMSTWHDLTKDVNNNPAYRALVGDVDELTSLRSPDSQGYFTQDYILFVPLIFWCNTNTGLALPLIALQYHEVRLWFQFQTFERLIVNSNNLQLSKLNNGNGVFNNASLLVDYVYIDTEERRRFAQIGHEYLINQLQYTGTQAVTQNPLRVTLTYNHPSKEFIWKIISGAYFSRNSPFLCYSNKDATETNSGWEDALNYAAQNLIRGSVTVGEGVGITDSKSPVVSISSGAYDEWNTVNIVTTNTRNTNKYSIFTYSAGAGIDDTQTPSDYAKILYEQVNGTGSSTNLQYAPAFLFRRDVFLNPLRLDYNLGDYVSKFTVVIFYSKINTTTNQGYDGYLQYQVVAGDNSIQIRDVSVPVSDWLDNRFTTADNTGSGLGAPMDIWAVFLGVSGLLINNKYNPVASAVIQLNGQDRFQPREGSYFNLIETYNYHHSTPANGVNVFSFALHPEQHQPSGTCNLSRIDNTVLDMALFRDTPYADPSRTPPPLSIVSSTSQCYIYCTNYNVLRVMSGMGGLAYSN
jgi:hypothetical protein